MNNELPQIIEVYSYDEIPSWFTGCVILLDEDSSSLYSTAKVWYLEGQFIWSSSGRKHDLRNEIILSKTEHPKYPNVQIWKILDKNKVYDFTVILGMEEYILE